MRSHTAWADKILKIESFTWILRGRWIGTDFLLLLSIELMLNGIMIRAYDEIRKIQAAARSGNPIDKPRWPMIISRSPKGWTGPARQVGEHGIQLVNKWVFFSCLKDASLRAEVEHWWAWPWASNQSFASHQVPLPQAKTDEAQLDLLNRWLASYEPDNLFVNSTLNNGSILSPLISSILPKEEQRLGRTRDSYANYKPLELTDWKSFGYEKNDEISCVTVLQFCDWIKTQCANPAKPFIHVPISIAAIVLYARSDCIW